MGSDQVSKVPPDSVFLRVGPCSVCHINLHGTNSCQSFLIVPLILVAMMRQEIQKCSEEDCYEVNLKSRFET